MPLLLGISKLSSLRHGTASDTIAAEEQLIQNQEHLAERRLHSEILAVAAVTIANGGDNLGVYIPLFASTPSGITLYAGVFAAMTAIWCALGYFLVKYSRSVIRRYGHVALPFVLIILGLYILGDAAHLLR